MKFNEDLIIKQYGSVEFLIQPFIMEHINTLTDLYKEEIRNTEKLKEHSTKTMLEERKRIDEEYTKRLDLLLKSLGVIKNGLW